MTNGAPPGFAGLGACKFADRAEKITSSYSFTRWEGPS